MLAKKFSSKDSQIWCTLLKNIEKCTSKNKMNLPVQILENLKINIEQLVPNENKFVSKVKIIYANNEVS